MRCAKYMGGGLTVTLAYCGAGVTSLRICLPC